VLSLADYKALLLDLGGVILNIHYERTLSAFRKLGFHDVETWYDGYHQKGFFDDFEEGRLSAEGFLAALKEHCPAADNTALLSAWNAMLGDVPQVRVQFLQSLRNKLPLFLFSNTNTLHHQHFNDSFQAQYGFPFESLFDAAFYSYRLGLRKPKPEAFRYVADVAGLNPSATLFVDDNPANTDGAACAGFKVYYLNPASGITLEKLFDF
jgi:putative hydrolase of the HAD superfamily